MFKSLLLVLFLLSYSLIATSQIKIDVKLEDVAKYQVFSQLEMQDYEPMKDGLHYSILENNGRQISKYNYASGQLVEVLLDLDAVTNNTLQYIEGYETNSDETKILLYTAITSIYRHSFSANYYVYDLIRKKIIPVASGLPVRLATLSPDGLKLAYVKDNNLLLFDLISMKETSITTDGELNKIINGAPDWVYEEEFSFTKAFDWSPDSKKLAYLRFDESLVKSYSMPLYKGASPSLSKNQTYPGQTTFKYPKAGEDNSIVSAWVYHLETSLKQKVALGQETNIYIPRIKWNKAAGILCVYKMNRLQNKYEILNVNPSDGSSKVLYTDQNKYYIDESVFNQFYFTEDGKNFIVANESDGFNHLYLYDISGKLINQITKGNFVVSKMLGFDAKTKIVYYEAAESMPMNREVFAINWNGKNKTVIANEFGINNVEFSKNFKYYIKTFTNVKTPIQITVHDLKGKLIRTIEDNHELISKLEKYNISEKKFFQFTTSNGTKLNGWMMYPVKMDSSKKYPVLITQYNGPNSQQVLNKWSLGWETVLTSKDIIVACIDTRGTGMRGEEFAKCTYLQLGKLETQDMIESAKYLGALKYIDKTRIGIWGWSYGGFMALSCITKGSDYFKIALSTAPVSNWRYYDNIYTERFMRTPQENQAGYDDNSPTKFASDFKGKLLIVHGSADDNVHMQNTLEMSEALVQANKQFDMQIYTNRNHSIYGGNTRFHLFSKFMDFIDKNL